MNSSAALANSYSPFALDQSANPYPIWEQARDKAPIFWSPVLQAWVVTRYDDIKEILRNPGLFVNEGATAPIKPPPAEVQAILAEGLPASALRPTVTHDGPEHVRLRRLLLGVLAPRYVLALEPMIRKIADNLIDDVHDDDQFDFIEKFAFRLPLTVLLDLLGLEGISFEKIHTWTTATLALFWGELPLDLHIQAARDHVEFQDYLLDLVAHSRPVTGDNLLSRLINLDQAEDNPLSDDRIVGVLIGLIAAGHETSMNLMSLTMLRCMSDRSLWEAMIEDAARIPAVVEESLRFNSPAHSIWRKASSDTEFAGAVIKAGDRITLVLGSGNRDQAMFDSPETFAPDRSTNPQHLAFGKGAHFCVGSPLARMEMQVAFEALTKRMPDINLVEGFVPEYRPSAVLRFLERLDLHPR